MLFKTSQSILNQKHELFSDGWVLARRTCFAASRWFSTSFFRFTSSTQTSTQRTPSASSSSWPPFSSWPSRKKRWRDSVVSNFCDKNISKMFFKIVAMPCQSKTSQTDLKKKNFLNNNRNRYLSYCWVWWQKLDK